MKFFGYPHDTGDLCYLAEFNGVNFDSSTANFSDGTANAPKSYDFKDGVITTGSFTFTARQAQTCMYIVVTTTKDAVLKFDKSEYSFDLTDLTANDHMPDPVNTTGATPAYTSGNKDVAECFNGGKPRIKSPGTTTITATAGGKTATYTLAVTSPVATYDLTGNAFEVKTTGTLDKKSLDLDGVTVTFGGTSETSVAVAQSDLGVGVMSIDYNGYTHFDNDFNYPVGSYVKLETTKAGTLRVKGNFAANNLTHVYLQNGADVHAFTQGNDYQEATLEADKTYLLTTWNDGKLPTFYLNAISYTTSDATSANATYGGRNLANGSGYQWPAKKGQKITISGHFYGTSPGRLFNISNVTDMNGNDVTTANVTSSVSFLVKEDGNVELTNNSGTTLYITGAVLENSTPSLSFEKQNPSVGVSASSFSNAVTNAPAATKVTYAISASSNASATIDANTGRLTNLKLMNNAENGTITITATSSALGYYNQGTGSYTLSIMNLRFANTNPNITLETSGAASYEQKVLGAPAGVVPVYSYAIVSGTPTVGLEQEQGSEDYNLTIKGTGMIQVTATCGEATASYTLTVSGLTFADVSPSISVDKEGDKGASFSQQPEDATVAIKSWAIVSRSNTITDATIDNNGNITGIKGYGIIEVKVTTIDDKSAEYVLTVADRAADGHDLVWDFNTKGNLPDKFGAATGDATTGAGVNKDGWTTRYEGATRSNGASTAYNHFIYTCNQPIDGDNALYIPATAGLQFTCNSNTFGLNNDPNSADDRHVSFRGNNSHDNVLTIPQLKQGDYVTIWWAPYSSADVNGNSGSGSTFRVTNATDLDGRSIDNTFSITGIAKPVLGQVTFRAKYNGDMSFYIQDNGWNDIYKIRVSRKYSTDLRLSEDKAAQGGVSAANNNLSILAGQTAIYKGDAGHIHSQAARTPVYSVKEEGDFKDGDVVWTPSNWTSKGGVTYTDLYITVNGGTGNLLVTQDIVCGADKYVLDRSQTWLAVGQVTQQTYPCTWDFTSYNMDAASTKTVDQLGATAAGNFGCWNNKTLNVIAAATPDPAKLAGYTVDKPLFANGCQLTCGTTPIPETEGLGVSLGNYNDDSNGRVGLDGNALSLSSTAATLTIPNVDAGMYVFVKADQKPTVSNATETTPASVVLPSGVYCYNVAAKGDVTLTFPQATKIEKIGVTNIFKAISNKATSESRDRAIDYSQTGVFTSMGMKAYIAKSYADGTGDMGTLTLQQVTAVPANTGLLLYKDLGVGQTMETQTSFPLFVPAVNVTPGSDKGMLTAHVTSGTVPGSDAGTLRYVFTNKYYHRGSDTQLTGDFLFYRVDQSGTLGANKAYLELKHSSAAKQFVVMSFEGSTTGIGAPQVRTDASNDAYYTVQGVKVNGRPAQSGIYIKNGKKVIVK